MTAALGELLKVGTVKVESAMPKVSIGVPEDPMVFVNAFIVNWPAEVGPGLMAILAVPLAVVFLMFPFTTATPPVILSVPIAPEAAPDTFTIEIPPAPTFSVAFGPTVMVPLALLKLVLVAIAMLMAVASMVPLSKLIVPFPGLLPPVVVEVDCPSVTVASFISTGAPLKLSVPEAVLPVPVAVA